MFLRQYDTIIIIPSFSIHFYNFGQIYKPIYYCSKDLNTAANISSRAKKSGNFWKKIKNFKLFLVNLPFWHKKIFINVIHRNSIFYARYKSGFIVVINKIMWIICIIYPHINKTRKITDKSTHHKIFITRLSGRQRYVFRQIYTPQTIFPTNLHTTK